MSEMQITRRSLLSMQVCVPKETTDADAEAFANELNPSGLERGWKMRHDGDEALFGAPARVPCEERPGCVHIMLDC